MAARYAHPYPVEGGRLPLFDTLHEARNFLAEYQGRGFIRLCAHAGVRRDGDGEWGGGGYAVHCRRDSFQVLTSDEPRATYESDTGSRFAIDNQFAGCPRGCRLYQPRWRGALSRWRRNQHPMIWFERQPPMVKVALIALPFLVAAAYFGVLRDLATLMRTIGEVWRGH